MKNQQPIDVRSFVRELFHHASRMNRGPVSSHEAMGLVPEGMTVSAASMRTGLLVSAVNNQRSAGDIKRLLGSPRELPTVASAFELLAGSFANPNNKQQMPKGPVQKQLLAACRTLVIYLKEFIGDGYDGNKPARTFYRTMFPDSKESAHAVLRGFVNITGAETSSNNIPDVRALTELLLQDYRS